MGGCETCPCSLALAILLSSVVFGVLWFTLDYWVVATSLGGVTILLLLSVLVYHLLSREAGLVMLTSVLTTAFLNPALKEAFRLPRPPVDEMLIEASGYGFPSGHAQAAASFWGVPLLRTNSICIRLLSVVMLSLISYSRLALRVHYPWDVIGGVFFGLITVLAYNWAIRPGARHRLLLVLTIFILTAVVVSPLYSSGLEPSLVATPGALIGVVLGHGVSREAGERSRSMRGVAALLSLVVGGVGYYIVTQPTRPEVVLPVSLLSGFLITYSTKLLGTRLGKR